MKEKIKNYLDTHQKGEEFEFEEMLPIDDIQTILVELGFEGTHLEGEESNGWYVDFWYTFNHPEKGEYELSGSLWYGEFKLRKKY